jgi:hypothetical protein
LFVYFLFETILFSACFICFAGTKPANERKTD